ncbi:MAG: biotin--[acetyl-CoA-carboxylase] ligase [Ignavibacteriales bacterium]
MSLRDIVLDALKNANGGWVSGEMLSESLHVSRTAVWKQIKSLQSDGYEIESSPKKGYRITSLPDLLSPTEITSGLTTKVWGRSHYLYFPEIDSTNRKARELAIQGYPEGTVVVAETQTAGRGRRGRSWYSPAGRGLYLSIILRPRLPLREISKISLLTAAAVAETLVDELGLNPQIKWPNDVLVGHKKIAGILSEVSTDMDSVEYIVLGIGLNLNMDSPELDQGFRTHATSAMLECDQPALRNRILQALLNRLEKAYYLVLSGHFAEILTKVKKLSTVLGQEVRLDINSGWLEGQAIDIDEAGFLLIRDQAGVVHTVTSGEICDSSSD